jgi:TonB family protein
VKSAPTSDKITAILRASAGSWQQPANPDDTAKSAADDTSTSRDNANSALGSVMGAEIGSDFGFGGVGLRGTGRGGGGPAEGAIKLGNVGTIGHGRGPAPAYGSEPGGFQGRDADVPHIKPSVLSQEDIQEVVAGHSVETRFCYQQELAAHPDLQGTVAVRFTINPDGTVAKAKVTKSTVATTRLGPCVASMVARWRFPESGESSTVSHAFDFKPE